MSRKIFVTDDMGLDDAIVNIAAISPESAMLWPWLLPYFDDWGRADANPRRIKGEIVPLFDHVTTATVDAALKHFADAKVITLYEVDGARYMCIDPQKWFAYQTHIHREKRTTDGSRIPACPAFTPSNHTETPRVHEDSRDNAKTSAQSRETPRDSAQSRASPSPSTLPPFHPSKKKSGDASLSADECKGRESVTKLYVAYRQGLHKDRSLVEPIPNDAPWAEVKPHLAALDQLLAIGATPSQVLRATAKLRAEYEPKGLPTTLNGLISAWARVNVPQPVPLSLSTVEPPLAPEIEISDEEAERRIAEILAGPKTPKPVWEPLA